MRVRVATRGSELALVQARWVAHEIETRLGFETELVRIKTSGDRLANVPLARLGGKGLFAKEIEEALLERRADVAVHSAKDLPAQLPDGLALAAFPARADPRDALVVRGGPATLEHLPERARVGTGSVRRRAQLRVVRPDLEVVGLRGNVPTRLRRLDEGRFDAVILACAGLDRLGLSERIHERIAPERLLPAVGQGVLALEARRDDPLFEALATLSDGATERAIRAERAFLARLEGDCNVPLAAFAECQDRGEVRIRALLAGPEGEPLLRAEASAHEPEAAGRRAAESILARGGSALLEQLRAEAPG